MHGRQKNVSKGNWSEAELHGVRSPSLTALRADCELDQAQAAAWNTCKAGSLRLVKQHCHRVPVADSETRVGYTPERQSGKQNQAGEAT